MADDATIGVLEAMRGQEEGAYTLPISSLVRSLTPRGGNDVGTKNLSDDILDYISWRRQMADWCLDMAAYLDHQIETVEVTLSILDRAVAADPSMIEDPELYQTACAASLLIAAKLHERPQLNIEDVARLCLFRFSKVSIQRMESHILFTIQWRVNPPTAVSFATHLLGMLDMGVSRKEAILQAVTKQIEKALVEEYFLTVKTSTLALAAVMNGLQQVCYPKMMAHFQCFQKALGYNKRSVPSRFTDVCNRLRPFLGVPGPCIEPPRRKSHVLAAESMSHRKTRSVSAPCKYRQ
jgi:hypothetical protein